MIEVTYENEQSPYADHFSAFFETERGCMIFIDALTAKNIDYTFEEGVEP